MNYLAHLYLADGTPDSLVGALLPDLVRGAATDPLTPAVRRAVEMHRRIDAFTDTHPMFLRSRKRLGAAHGLFAGVLVDMFYDHLLAADWSRYAAEALPDFIARVYAVFGAHEQLMPAPMRPPIRRMIDQDWLGSYATLDGLTMRLAQMSIRLSARLGRSVRLDEAVPALSADRCAFAADFHAFFPLLIAHVATPAPLPPSAEPVDPARDARVLSG